MDDLDFDDNFYTDSRGAEVIFLPFSAALKEIMNLAEQNLPDEHDILEPGVYDMGVKQGLAISKVSELLSTYWIDTLEKPTAALYYIMKEYPANSFAEAIQTVWQMAQQVSIEPTTCNSVDMSEECDRQQLAFDIVEDLLTMHAEEIDNHKPSLKV